MMPFEHPHETQTASWCERAAADGLSRDDDRLAEGGVRHLGREAVRLLEQGRHDVGLRHGLDDLALDENLALAVARRDAEVCLARLARAVDDAAHDGDAKRHGEPLETSGDLVGKSVDIHLGTPTARARHDLELALAQIQALKN